MKPLTLSAAVMALLVLPASSTFAASNDRHRARSHDGAYAGAYGYEGGISRPLNAGGVWSPARHAVRGRSRCGGLCLRSGPEKAGGVSYPFDARGYSMFPLRL